MWETGIPGTSLPGQAKDSTFPSDEHRESCEHKVHFNSRLQVNLVPASSPWLWGRGCSGHPDQTLDHLPAMGGKMEHLTVQ